MFSVTIGSQLWNCGYRFTSKSRITAYRKAKAAVMRIPDAALRPTDETLDAAYASLAQWDRSQRSKSPRMSHEPGNRAYYMDIERH
jgi:hypothetical protein